MMSMRFLACGLLLLASPALAQWKSGVRGLTQAKDYSGSCGKCKEVRCKHFNFKDGSSTCYDTTASVVVMVVDTCPCYYPTNYFSNKRWCCGDMYHMDISVWAFEKLADTKYGVIGMEYRDVDCGYRPANPAKNPWGGRTSMPPKLRPRPGWNRWQDKRLPFMREVNPTSLFTPVVSGSKPVFNAQGDTATTAAAATSAATVAAPATPLAHAPVQAAAPAPAPAAAAAPPPCVGFFCLFGRRLLRA
ncbi:hypothetical protein MNEG_1676 [Monoraphidium neglectum]|uniref:Expansin-like EG45 domain-containing protein n=1 Tax=Monoraphidium neglectum TaxID=145388 RepID=A0A0D2K7S7_9CHLO|nr:hypothetical protein MNEG_1676 [Monoraphidium neglectum]KIZ06273.1 hypothetical protein MNEG_1676 [Monoraphidium neglectum]|eukprot:XP_013905292.1 hypothetical protein MNEG_1676 [Monoraphidium neglectum]